MPIDAGLASASDNLLFAAVVAYVVAMLGYFVEFASGRRVPLPIAGGATDTALPPSYVASVESASRRGRLGLWCGRGAVALTVVGWGLHAGAAVLRGLATDRVPWGNMYEFSSMVCLIGVTSFLVLLVRQPVRYLGGFVMLPVVLTLGLASSVLYAPAAPLVPALNSYWIKIHVVAAMTAFGVFMVGIVATLLYLVAVRLEARGRGASRLPAAASLDRVAYRTIAFAFPIWTFAVMAGAVWAEASWGRYWGWDPKETWSFITWVLYAGYLHARATAGWRGSRAAWVAVAGFVALMFTYYGVNIWIPGLHSYSGV
ncbi:MAG TPA: c-type cytochrome biogenesis protein CcsB [Frankiaceae bacterium]|nr:c-type cytochrome biogenesis protein CcsB [Frankiaceae bacterium]